MTFTDQLRQHTQTVLKPIINLLAQIGVTPNMLTWLGLLIHLPIGYLLAQGRWRLAALVGIFSLTDALDGALARQLGTAGKPFGAFLDSTLDRISEIILFGGMIYYFNQNQQTGYLFLAFAAATGSLMVSYSRARAEALGVSCKDGLFSRVERYLILFVCGLAQWPVGCVVILAVGTWLTTLQRGVLVWRHFRVKR